MGFLQVRNVSKNFGEVEVLHQVSLSAEQGEFLVLVGPSGCGKSTLLNMIAGLETITDGEISIRDRVVNDVHPSKRNIAMVFQSYALYPNMSVAQNITFGLEMHGVPHAERESALQDVAKLLQIEALLDRKPRQLSGGQRQRVAMGRALVRDPDVFLFDEPLSNLDAKLRVDMRTEIKKLHQSLGSTIVYVTHDQIEAMTLSTRIAVMNEGKIQQLGTPRDVYDSPSNIFVATFMGSPSMNLFTATASADDKGVYAEAETGAGETLRLRMADTGSALSNYAGKEITVGIRPESITDPDGAARDDAASQIMRNRTIVVEPAGADTFATCLIGGKECVARVRADADIRPGEIAEFSVKSDKAIPFDSKTGERIA